MLRRLRLLAMTLFVPSPLGSMEPGKARRDQGGYDCAYDSIEPFVSGLALLFQSIEPYDKPFGWVAIPGDDGLDGFDVLADVFQLLAQLCQFSNCF